MLYDLQIGVRGEDVVKRKIGLAFEVLGDLTEVWDDSIHPFMIDHMKSQFKSDGAHGGSPWALYGAEPKYTAYKIALVGHLTPLRWQKGGPFERLFPSLVDRSDRDHVWESSAKGAVFGTSLPYAGDLNAGGIGPFGERYPARKIIAMRQDQKKKMISAIQQAIVQRFGGGAIRAARRT